MTNSDKPGWTEIISSSSRSSINFKELLRYRDLIFLFVKRDFVKEFKQTILGPLWFVIQPIFQTLVLLFVFGKIGNMGPEGMPQTSFYLGGTMLWNLFAENLKKTSETFRANAQLFGKVYFPRIIIPVSLLFTNYLKYAVQFVIFLVVYFYEMIVFDVFEPGISLLLIPVYIMLTSLLGLGMGLIISAMTTKYWDLRFLVQFGIQLLMFLSAVITPVTTLPEGSWMKFLILANPVSSYIEGFRYAFLGSNGGEILPYALLYSIVATFIVLSFGMLIFQRVERSFIDTV